MRRPFHSRIFECFAHVTVFRRNAAIFCRICGVWHIRPTVFSGIYGRSFSRICGCFAYMPVFKYEDFFALFLFSQMCKCDRSNFLISVETGRTKSSLGLTLTGGEDINGLLRWDNLQERDN